MINVLQLGKDRRDVEHGARSTGGPTVQHGCRHCRGIVTKTPARPATVSAQCRVLRACHLAKFAKREPAGLIRTSFGSGSIEERRFKNPGRALLLSSVYNAATTPSDFLADWKGKTVS